MRRHIDLIYNGWQMRVPVLMFTLLTMYLPFAENCNKKHMKLLEQKSNILVNDNIFLLCYLYKIQSVAAFVKE